MGPEHKLLLALSDILKPLHPHLDDLHAEVEKSAARGGGEERQRGPSSEEIVGEFAANREMHNDLLSRVGALEVADKLRIEPPAKAQGVAEPKPGED